MRLYTCNNCGQLVYFENTSCTRCHALLGFNVGNFHMESLTASEDGSLRLLGNKPGGIYKYCANGISHEACNWILPDSDENELCVACRLNRTIPYLGIPNNVVLWKKIEVEKRRLIYSLLQLKLTFSPQDNNLPSLAFDFLANNTDEANYNGTGDCILTGHANGLITLNINEADSAYREKIRTSMSESYRTLLGHFRHESGHYYWDLLVRESEWLAPVRELFGDDTVDYDNALQTYYQNGPATDWQLNFVSAYASMHPWEDWAETWAHYLHIIDTLETAHEFGIKIHPHVTDNKKLHTDVEINPYDSESFRNIVEHWLPLTYALNSLSRSVGHEHAYPFVLAEPVINKLDLIHRILLKNMQHTNY